MKTNTTLQRMRFCLKTVTWRVLRNKHQHLCENIHSVIKKSLWVWYDVNRRDLASMMTDLLDYCISCCFLALSVKDMPVSCPSSPLSIFGILRHQTAASLLKSISRSPADWIIKTHLEMRHYEQWTLEMRGINWTGNSDKSLWEIGIQFEILQYWRFLFETI